MRARPWILCVTALLCSGPLHAAGKSRLATAAAGTPSGVLAGIPALPKAAKKDLDCSAKETIEARVQQLIMEQAAAQQDVLARREAPQAISDTQAEALKSLDDPEFYSCVSDLQQRPPELWIDAQREKLDAKLATIDEALAKAPGNVKKYNAQAVAAATQFLKDALPAYSDYMREIATCVGRRDAVIATARGAGAGPQFDAALASGAQQNWDLVGIAAGAQSAVCNAARDAAGRYLEPAP